MAFDRAKGCPTDWTQFSPAADRVIIGVGGKYELPYVAETPKYQLGGEEKVALDIKKILAHEHRLIVTTEKAQAPAGTARTFVYTVKIGASKYAKAAASHNNMPPYIALYFCKKVAP